MMNQIDLDRDRFVRRDRSSPMKKNTFISFNAIFSSVTYITVLCNLSHPVPTDWLILHHMRHGRGLQNLSVKSDFSQMLSSRSGFDNDNNNNNTTIYKAL